MADADDFIQWILGDLRNYGGVSMVKTVYHDEPIARKARYERVRTPKRIAEMRAIAREFDQHGYYYGAGPELFWRQATFMADYEDDLPYHGEFNRYYPTYEDMSNQQLRGYFTWRTEWRRGETPAAPQSFLFVHAYEVLCGVGVESGQAALEELTRLRESYRSDFDKLSLDGYVRRWQRDYVIYHGLPVELAVPDGPHGLVAGVPVLREAEQALLAGLPVPSEKALVDAMSGLTVGYDVNKSLVRRKEGELFDSAVNAAFAGMVEHCRRRRKMGYVDSLFGISVAKYYTMFPSAVFYDPVRHPDVEVELADHWRLVCRNGIWTEYLPFSKNQRSRELGTMLHTIERLLRERLGMGRPLKERKLPKYQAAIVEGAVKAALDRREEELRPRVVIDRTRLGGIRSAAARTREALLVDEERNEESIAEPVSAPASAPEPLAAPEPEASASTLGLTPVQLALVRALLDGTFDAAAFEREGAFLSLEADRINETFFDLVGDAVIEFDGDAPRLVEDYLDDVREALA